MTAITIAKGERIMSDQENNNRTEELRDEELNQVSGGINPQPLPPRGDPRS
jgi:bacteriocin-like protein